MTTTDLLALIRDLHASEDHRDPAGWDALMAEDGRSHE